MTVEITDVADTAPRRAIASFDPYEDAQALVDRPADGGFAVGTLVGAVFEFFVLALSGEPGRPAVR
jgi:hypothetical protein